MLKILYEEDKLSEIVKLVGEDVLPDDQRLVMEVAKCLKVAFLQQNAYHDLDTYVPLEKQYKMLKVIESFYDEGNKAVKIGTPISVIIDKDIMESLYKMKYNVPNDDFSIIDDLERNIKNYFDEIIKKYK